MTEPHPINQAPQSHPAQNTEASVPTAHYNAADSALTSQDSGWGAFEKFLGPKGFAQFKTNVCNTISRQIGHDQKKAKEASDDLKKSTTGEE